MNLVSESVIGNMSMEYQPPQKAVNGGHGMWVAKQGNKKRPPLASSL